MSTPEEFTAGASRIVVGDGVLDGLRELVATAVRPHRAAIITDTNVGPLYAARVAAALRDLSPVVSTLPAGEASKTRDTWARITDELLAAGLGRDSVVVALGGGVVGDLGGFVAATYMRGVPVVQVPTSLVAMIDAAIGGKTGVDTTAGKNLVGAFHAPALVAVDPGLLETLPPRELRCGLAEALKHGAIADAAYFRAVAENGAALQRAASSDRHEIVSRSIAIKSAVVTADPRESGQRKILNFGHTFGHAIESASGYTLPHGEAVAIGMVLEARLGERLGVTAAGTADAMAAALTSLGLPTTSPAGDASDIVARTHGDKKTVAGRVEYALPAAIGSFGAWTTPVDDAVALELLRNLTG